VQFAYDDNDDRNISSDIFILRIPETLPQDVLTKMHAPPKPDYPVISPAELAQFDGILCGIPTRYGNFPAQWKVRIYPALLFASGWSLDFSFFLVM